MDDDDRLRDTAGCPSSDRFDLAELDAVAAHLDLVVDAAEALEPAVGAPAGEVAGAVHPRAARRRERIRDEPLGRQLGAVEVAARHAVAADVQLAGHADGTGCRCASST